jgi:hypothetical protein
MRADEVFLRTRETLLTPAQLAEWLQVDRSYVYAHADELGAIRLGAGKRARLRFDLEEVRRRLPCSTSRGADDPGNPAPEPIRRRRRTRALGTNVPLLPIRGPIPASRAVRGRRRER